MYKKRWKGAASAGQLLEPYRFPDCIPLVVTERAEKAWEAALICRLRIARADLERFINEHPDATYDNPEAKAVLKCYLTAMSHRLYQLNIEPRSDRSYLEADILQWRKGSRELPFLRLRYIE
jgi:hypothetical protein